MKKMKLTPFDSFAFDSFDSSLIPFDSQVHETRQKNRGSSPAALLLFLWIISVAFNAGATRSDIKYFERPKISRFQEPGEFVWCGTKHLAISKHGRGADAGIRLLDIESGHVRQLTTVKTHRVVACTPDGKHIFFVENAIRGTMNEFDIDSGKQQVIYSKNVFQHEAIEEVPISPSGEHLIGPVTLSKRVTLSDRTLNGVHIPDGFSEKNFTGIAWSRDGTVFFVIGSDFGDNKNNPQKLLIQNPGNPHPREISLPSIKNAQFRQAEWSDMTKRLYLLAWSDTAKLYEFDPEKPAHSLRLMASVDEFKLMPNGDLVYIKNFGADYSSKPDVAIIDQRAHRSLLLRTHQGKLTELLKVSYKSLGISSIQLSPDGKAIAVRITKIDGRNDSMEIQIFQTDEN